MDNQWRLRSLTAEDLQIAHRLKPSDADEIAALGLDPYIAVSVSADCSSLTEAIDLNGELVGAWGFALESDTCARIWLVSTPAAVRNRRAYLALARELVSIGLAHAPELYNWISVDNRESRRLVRALGFIEDEERVFQPTGARMIKIRKLRYVH